jgi:hypothetical protein
MQSDSAIKTVNQMSLAMTQRTDHPAAKSGMIPEKIVQIGNQAVQVAFSRVKEQYKLNDSQIEALKRGDAVGARLEPNKAAEIANRINLEQTFAEYDLFEQQRPGLGYEVQQWMSNELPTMARNYANSLPPMQRAVVGDQLANEAQQIMTRYLQADESANQRASSVIQQMQTGAKRPENSWLLMLNMTERLSDSQRQAIYYDVLEPVMKAARSQGLNDEQTSAAAMQALGQYRSDDPTMNSAVKSLQREMPSVIDKFQQMWAATIMMGESSKVYGQRMVKDPKLSNDKLRQVIPWVK